MVSNMVSNIGRVLIYVSDIVLGFEVPDTILTL